ncbi:hypothetical protein [Rugosimonospora africana]|uniref:hypothetical protein n=1 Tax=Rugosimonospora africana TaxID=556532 RepID=UPI0019436334|nr:hypothetical protein [Rugosimonospora africana]
MVTPVMPRAETRHLLHFLLGDTAGRRTLGRIDEKVDKLPGLAGLHMLRRAATAYGIA